jgi:hypothetical protein
MLVVALQKRQAQDGIRMVSGESGGECRPKSAKWENLCNLRNLCEVSFTKGISPQPASSKLIPRSKQKTPTNRETKTPLLGGVFVLLIAGLTIPKGLRPKFLETNA